MTMRLQASAFARGSSTTISKHHMLMHLVSLYSQHLELQEGLRIVQRLVPCARLPVSHPVNCKLSFSDSEALIMFIIMYCNCLLSRWLRYIV